MLLYAAAICLAFDLKSWTLPSRILKQISAHFLFSMVYHVRNVERLASPLPLFRYIVSKMFVNYCLRFCCLNCLLQECAVVFFASGIGCRS